MLELCNAFAMWFQRELPSANLATGWWKNKASAEQKVHSYGEYCSVLLKGLNKGCIAWHGRYYMVYLHVSYATLSAKRKGGSLVLAVATKRLAPGWPYCIYTVRLFDVDMTCIGQGSSGKATNYCTGS